jgi:hypothetical protein
MVNSARRDSVGELALMLRAPEPESRNLGAFAAAYAADLAPALGVDPKHLEALDAVLDETAAPRLRALVDRHRQELVAADQDRRRQRSFEAAQRLGATVRWTEIGAELDVDLLLGEMLADRTKKWLAFDAQGALRIVVPRHLVAGVAPLRRVHIDLACFLDDRGLHFRWRGGRGGYDWRGHEVDPRFYDQVLVVPIAPRVVQVRERRRGGAWLGHILKELGYVPL